MVPFGATSPPQASAFMAGPIVRMVVKAIITIVGAIRSRRIGAPFVVGSPTPREAGPVP